MELRNFLRSQALENPQDLALEFENSKWTFQDLDQQAVFYGEKLAALGVTSGSRIAFHTSNCPEAVFIIHALLYLGAKIVFLNTRLTKSELTWQLEHAKVELVVTTEDFCIEAVKCVSVQTLLNEKSTPFVIKEFFQPSDVVTIMYTSGTTGKPKAVQQTYGNHYYSALYSSDNLSLEKGAKWLCMMPLYHISGASILFRSVISGISVLLHQKFSSEKANYDIAHRNVTIVSAVTNMLTRMLVDEPSYPSTFKGMLLGGGSAPKSLLETCRNQGISIYQTYGMTETCSQIATLSPQDMLAKLGSAGKPLGQCELKIIDQNGQPCASFASGEIVVKGSVVTPGYLYQESAAAFSQGWFHTGDIGYLDDEGFLYVQDRRSDLIISGGENVYPAEIESVLLSHDHVVEAGVVGIADDHWGQVPVAFIVRSGMLLPEELQQFCCQKLARYKVPKYFYFVRELPRNATGKLLRKELKAIKNG